MFLEQMKISLVNVNAPHPRAATTVFRDFPVYYFFKIAQDNPYTKGAYYGETHSAPLYHMSFLKVSFSFLKTFIRNLNWTFQSLLRLGSQTNNLLPDFSVACINLGNFLPSSKSAKYPEVLKLS